jgi:ubiquinone/menaquinone biosynthesis C-methylase UbiE
MAKAPGAETFHQPSEATTGPSVATGAELARLLLAAADVRGGETALDVGCGPGALTGELVALLGAENVAAGDPSPPFVEACRRRLPVVRVEAATAEALPFADAAFDNALAQLAVNFMAEPPAGVQEMRRGDAAWRHRGRGHVGLRR